MVAVQARPQEPTPPPPPGRFVSLPIPPEQHLRDLLRSPQPNIRACVTAEALRKRHGPGTEYTVAGWLNNGDCLTFDARNQANSWGRVVNKDEWVSFAYIDIINSSRLPVAEASFSAPQIIACPYGCTYPPTGCSIKGNISYNTGEKIYHMPGQNFYSVTVINPDYGERWFCTEDEARANGWRKAQN